jgi:hypothetical protein
MSADTEMSEVIEEVAVVIKKKDVLMSPQDVIIECKGEYIQTHAVVLRRCEYFATLLDNADLDSAGPGSIKIIALPATFDHNPSELREFIMVLYDTIEATGAAHLEHYVSLENVVALVELAHYFHAPLLQAACDEALANFGLVWFPDKLLWLMQVAIKNHLPLLRTDCMAALAGNIVETGLLAHFDRGHGALCKDPVFVTELITILNQNHVDLAGEYDKEHARVIAFQQNGTARCIKAFQSEFTFTPGQCSRLTQLIENEFKFF